MSYDLMVFEPSVAPRNRVDCLAWYEKITQWKEGHDYNDPKNTAPALQGLYREMIKLFPAMNGPDAPSPTDPIFDSPYITAIPAHQRQSTQTLDGV